MHTASRVMISGLWLFCGCATANAPAEVRAAAAGTSAPPPAAAPASMSTVLPAPSSPVLPAPAATGSTSTTTAIAGCTPGKYAGTYDIGILGMGPITFTLVAAEMPKAATPCQEFCPDLVLSSEGGEFYASWLGFVGEAMLKGGLDCKTGEFRAEMVNGKYGISANPDDPKPRAPDDGSPLIGTFTGKFTAGSPPGISGDISCDPSGFGFMLDGTFMVQPAP